MAELAKLGLDGWPLALVAVVLLLTPILSQAVGDRIRALRERGEKEAAEAERKAEKEAAEADRAKAEEARKLLDIVIAQLTTTNGGSHVRDALNALGEGQERIVDEVGLLRGTVAELRDGVRAVEIETARLGARVDVLERDRQPHAPRWRRW